MNSSCTICGQSFTVTDDDLAFYDKVSPEFNGKKYPIPPPDLCPDCRQQRRLSFRNERSLYHRKSDLSGKQIISMYSQDKSYTVYDQDEWWSDQWDGVRYGKDFDFNRPFFEQFAQLMLEVPRISLMNKAHENSEYCNFSLHNKDCYLLFTSGDCKDAYYCNRAGTAQSVADASNIRNCELGYELVDCDNCYGCAWLQNCINCSDCWFGDTLKGCHNCFACFGLTNASLCIGNKQLTEEDYRKTVEELKRDLPSVQQNFAQHLLTMPRKYMESIGSENCTGNAIQNSKNAIDCYEVMNIEDCRHVSNATQVKDCQDVNNADNCELLYESVGNEQNYHHLFSDICWFTKETMYCSSCFHCEYLFGCVGLQHKKYCILNKQHTKEEYEQIVPKIIEHMRKTKEYGEFFPRQLSPFGYNETMAMEHFPLTRDQAVSQGWKWHDDQPQKDKYLGPKIMVPDSITDVDDSITSHILTCEITGKPYKIIPKELKLYRQMAIPLPKRSPDQRHLERLQQRSSRKLWHRSCMKCNKAIETSYGPNRPEIVYCERCFLETAY